MPARARAIDPDKGQGSEGLRRNARKSGERLADSGEFGGSGCAFALLQKRLSRLVPAAAQSRKSAGASMAASRSSKFSRNPRKLLQSVATVGRQCCIRILFSRGNGFIQQCLDFLAGDVARRIALVPGVAHFVRICGKEFSFQGVEQRC